MGCNMSLLRLRSKRRQGQGERDCVRGRGAPTPGGPPQSYGRHDLVHKEGPLYLKLSSCPASMRKTGTQRAQILPPMGPQGPTRRTAQQPRSGPRNPLGYLSPPAQSVDLRSSYRHEGLGPSLRVVEGCSCSHGDSNHGTVMLGRERRVRFLGPDLRPDE